MSLFYWLVKGACESLIDTYISLLIVTVLIVNYINCTNVREYHGHSLTSIKSLS